MLVRKKTRLEKEAERILQEAAASVVGSDTDIDEFALHAPEHFNLVRWLKENCYIQKKGGGTIPFDDWWPVQKKIAALIVKMFALGIPVVLVILKSRQLGVSTIIRAVIFALTRHHQHTTGLLVAQTRETTKSIFREVKTLLECLPKEEKDRLPVESGEAGVTELRYKHPWMSQMLVRVKEAGMRNQMVNYAHFSECDLIPEFMSLWSALLAAVPKPEVNPKTLVVAETTVKGKRQFYRLWKQAQDPKSGMIPLFIGLKEDPTARIPLEPGEVLELDEEEQAFMDKHSVEPPLMKWIQRTLRKECLGDWNLLNSEYPIDAEVAFGSGVGEYFKEILIKAHTESAPNHIFRGTLHFENDWSPRVISKPLAYGPITIWEEPEAGVSYAMGVDVGHGIFRDYTVGYVKRCDTKVTVAQFRSNKIEPGSAAIDIYLLGAYYGFPLLGVENNGPGLAMLTVLKDGHLEVPQTISGYPALYYHTQVDSKTHVEHQRMGYATTGKSKTSVLERLRMNYNNGGIVEVSRDLLWEMDGFFYDSITKECVQVNQDPASKMYHDDCVMAEAIAYEMAHEMTSHTYCRPPKITYHGVVQ